VGVVTLNTQSQTKQHTKKTYTSPRLITFGSVRSLTQAGSAVFIEGIMFNMMNYRASDRLTKKDIVKLDIHPLGCGLYLFDYKPEYCEQWGAGRQLGVLAQEVELVMPQAVSIHPVGYKMVDYAMLGISHPETECLPE
jgi:hypothetical protein